MKKIWLLTTLLVAGLLLTECNKTVIENPEIIDDCITVDWEDWCAVDIDEPVVDEPTYEILERTGYMWCIWWCEDWSDEEYVEWYYYRYTNPELGLRITTPSWDGWNYNLNFRTKRETPIFKQIDNGIYSLEFSDEDLKYAEFINVYEKDPGTSLEEMLDRKYGSRWCEIWTGDIKKDGIFDWFWDYSYEVRRNYDIEDSNNYCTIREEGEEWRIFLVESKDGTKYYKIRMDDWCAPWPCSIFWKVEVL